MHDTAAYSCIEFLKAYGKSGITVLDVGGAGTRVGGLVKKFGMNYLCMDLKQEAGVDIVMEAGNAFPLEDESIDLIYSSSCFEHDPLFWLTFREMCRVVKKGGYIYISAPSNGPYHTHPVDNWRFYSDAGQALALWSSKQIVGLPFAPVEVVETFHILPHKDRWIDFVCIWKRAAPETVSSYLTPEAIRNEIGPLEAGLHREGLKTRKLLP